MGDVCALFKRKNAIIFTTIVVAFFFSPVFVYSFDLSNETLTGDNPYTWSFDVINSTGGQSYLGVNFTDFLLLAGTDQRAFESCDGIILLDETPPPFLWQLCYKPFTGDGSYSFTFAILEDREVSGINADVSNDNTGVDEWFNDIDWDSASSVFDTYIFIGNPISSSIWAGSNGFWGSVTPSDVFSTMSASVAETGQSIFPMFALIGVPIAFLLGLALVNFIYSQNNPPKKQNNRNIRVGKKRRKQIKYDLIEHSASDLEFKRNYGSVTKE